MIIQESDTVNSAIVRFMGSGSPFVVDSMTTIEAISELQDATPEERQALIEAEGVWWSEKPEADARDYALDRLRWLRDRALIRAGL